MLGLGAGWHRGEHQRYGLVFPEIDKRLHTLRQTIRTCRTVWTDSSNGPRPRHATIPIIVGGDGRKILSIVANLADIWNSRSDLAAFRYRNGLLDDACAKAGRDPTSLVRTVTIAASDVRVANDYRNAGASLVVVVVPPTTPPETLAKIMKQARQCG